MTSSVLLIGGSSPLGRLIGAELARSGLQVVATSRRGVHPLDVTDPRSVDEVFAHGSFSDVVYLANPDQVDDTQIRHHLEGFRWVVESARRAGSDRVVFMSSAAVYGTADPRPQTEGSPLAGSSPYAHLKHASEQILVDAADDGLLGVVLRVFNVWGPGFHRSLINRLEDPASAPPLQLDGDFVRDYIHGGDVARAVDASLKLEAAGSVTVNIATGVGVSNAELARMTRTGYYTVGPEGPPSYSVADVRRAYDVLGWEARHRVGPRIPSRTS